MSIQCKRGAKIERRERIVGSLVGLAVRDALGTTLEFTRADQVIPVSDIVGGGPFRLEPSEWTDDTSNSVRVDIATKTFQELYSI